MAAIQDLSKDTIKKDFWAECDTVLTHDVTIIIPVSINPTYAGNLIKHTATTFADLFGGCTITTGQGFYKSNNGLIIENVTLINSSCLNLDKSNVIYNLAVDIKAELKQESVAVKIDGKLYFV